VAAGNWDNEDNIRRVIHYYRPGEKLPPTPK
jgi:hypothetical protein